MEKDYSAFERLLGLPAGSTAQGEEELRPLLADGIKQKTTELTKKANQIDIISNMPTSEIVKYGFTLETLEEDKLRIRNDTFEVYSIARALLDGYKTQMDRAVNPNDRMWMAGAKLIDSVSGSLDKLLTMTMKFKQEEEMKGMTLVSEADKSTREMNPKSWFEFIKQVKETSDEELGEIIDHK